MQNPASLTCSLATGLPGLLTLPVLLLLCELHVADFAGSLTLQWCDSHGASAGSFWQGINSGCT